jgi:hypothetical protein
MLVLPPHEETSPEGSVNGGGSTGIPDWQLWNWDINTFQRVKETALVEEEDLVPATVELIQSLQCWMACLAKSLMILQLCCTIFHCLLR